MAGATVPQDRTIDGVDMAPILFQKGAKVKHTTSIRTPSVERGDTLSSVSNVTFVYLTTSEMRTLHYSGHFHLSQMTHLCT